MTWREKRALRSALRSIAFQERCAAEEAQQAIAPFQEKAVQTIETEGAIETSEKAVQTQAKPTKVRDTAKKQRSAAEKEGGPQESLCSKKKGDEENAEKKKKATKPRPRKTREQEQEQEQKQEQNKIKKRARKDEQINQKVFKTVQQMIQSKIDHGPPDECDKIWEEATRPKELSAAP